MLYSLGGGKGVITSILRGQRRKHKIILGPGLRGTKKALKFAGSFGWKGLVAGSKKYYWALINTNMILDISKLFDHIGLWMETKFHYQFLFNHQCHNYSDHGHYHSDQGLDPQNNDDSKQNLLSYNQNNLIKSDHSCYHIVIIIFSFVITIYIIVIMDIIVIIKCKFLNIKEMMTINTTNIMLDMWKSIHQVGLFVLKNIWILGDCFCCFK